MFYFFLDIAFSLSVNSTFYGNYASSYFQFYTGAISWFYGTYNNCIFYAANQVYSALFFAGTCTDCVLATTSNNFDFYVNVITNFMEISTINAGSPIHFNLYGGVLTSPLCAFDDVYITNGTVMVSNVHFSGDIYVGFGAIFSWAGAVAISNQSLGISGPGSLSISTISNINLGGELVPFLHFHPFSAYFPCFSPPFFALPLPLSLFSPSR